MTASRLVYRHTFIPFNPKYPNAWRGYTCVAFRIFNTILRLSWSYRRTENDPTGIDSACRWDFSPRWARGLHIYGYYGGNHRNIYHFSFWRLGFSAIPYDGFGMFL